MLLDISEAFDKVDLPNGIFNVGLEVKNRIADSMLTIIPFNFFFCWNNDNVQIIQNAARKHDTHPVGTPPVDRIRPCKQFRL